MTMVGVGPRGGGPSIGRHSRDAAAHSFQLCPQTSSWLSPGCRTRWLWDLWLLCLSFPLCKMG